jgi:xanthine dehydrogenase YagT iron-sulfur-binding subunit
VTHGSVRDAVDRSTLTLHVNGESRTLLLDHRATVLDVLREHLGLTGAKKGSAVPAPCWSTADA